MAVIITTSEPKKLKADLYQSLRGAEKEIWKLVNNEGHLTLVGTTLSSKHYFGTITCSEDTLIFLLEPMIGNYIPILEYNEYNNSLVGTIKNLLSVEHLDIEVTTAPLTEREVEDLLFIN